MKTTHSYIAKTARYGTSSSGLTAEQADALMEFMDKISAEYITHQSDHDFLVEAEDLTKEQHDSIVDFEANDFEQLS